MFVKNKSDRKIFKKKYENPFLMKENKIAVRQSRKKIKLSLPKIRISKANLKLKLIIFASIIFILFLCWFLFFSSVFNIKKVEVYNTKNIPKDMIEKITWEKVNSSRWLFFSQNNLFVFSKKELRFDLEVMYKFDELDIYKDFPDTIVINANEKKYSLIWEEENKYYYIDYDGNIILEAESSPENYVKIVNKGSSRKDNRVIKIDKKYLEAAIKIDSLFKEKFKNLKVKEFVIDDTYNTVKISISRGCEIYFNTDNNLNDQFSKLDIFLKKEVKDKMNKLKYIDLRFGDKIFYQ